MDLFVLTRIADLLKTPPPVNPMVAASLAALRRDPSRSGSGPRVGWASSMSVLTVRRICLKLVGSFNHVYPYRLLCDSVEV